MNEPGMTGEQGAACAADRERVRALSEALEREREQRLRLEEAGEETDKLVHSLNNVLSIISAYASSLADEVEPDHACRESLDEVTRAAKRAVGIARKLTDVRQRAKDEAPDHGRA